MIFGTFLSIHDSLCMIKCILMCLHRRNQNSSGLHAATPNKCHKWASTKASAKHMVCISVSLFAVARLLPIS